MNASNFESHSNQNDEGKFAHWLRDRLGPDGIHFLADHLETQFAERSPAKLGFASRQPKPAVASIMPSSTTDLLARPHVALGNVLLDVARTENETENRRWTLAQCQARADKLAEQLLELLPNASAKPPVCFVVAVNDLEAHGQHNGGLKAAKLLCKSLQQLVGESELPRQLVADVCGGEARPSGGPRRCVKLYGNGFDEIDSSRDLLFIIKDDVTNEGVTLLVVQQFILGLFPKAEVRCVVLAASTNLTRWSPRLGETRWRRCPVVQSSGEIEDITLLSSREIDYVVGFPWDPEVPCSSNPGFVPGNPDLVPGRLVRPWGTRVALATQMDNMSISELVLKPNEEISFHFHQRRQEMFYAVTPLVVDTGPNLKKILGERYGGDVTRLADENERLWLKSRLKPQMIRTIVQPGERLFFEPLRPHRICTLPDQPAVSLEFARGDYRQQDIVRIDDRYPEVRKAMNDPSDVDIVQTYPWVGLSWESLMCS